MVKDIYMNDIVSETVNHSMSFEEIDERLIVMMNSCKKATESDDPMSTSNYKLMFGIMRHLTKELNKIEEVDQQQT